MLDALKPLLESGIVNDETRAQIQEAWEAKIDEVREQSKAELREEFARRYEHDKTVMVEALDTMVSESLQDELRQIVAEKKALAEDRVAYNKKMTESAKKFDNFMVTKLAEEIRDLRADRKAQASALGKLEEFMVSALAEEIEDFQADKRDLAETKVKLVKEAKNRFKVLESEFIKRSAKLVEQTVTNGLTKEITQLKEDITASRKNDFGRQIFEAFAAEFGASHHNVNQEIKKLEQNLADQAQTIAEAKAATAKAVKLAESKERELSVVKDRVARNKALQELLQPLSRVKANEMKSLLENVETSKLKSAFDKYLPAVLNEGSRRAPAKKQVIAESAPVKTAATGNKKPMKKAGEGDVIEIDSIRKLAGI